jgi:5-methylcytosine-specific restriction endonuclease McrA
MGTKRIKGNDRFIMMLARDVRRRWLQYGLNRKLAKRLCNVCNKIDGTEIDHIEPVGSRPHIPQGFGDYIERMIYIPCQRLCKQCHLKKTNEERAKRKNK